MAQTLASELNQPLNPSFLSQSSQRMQSDPNLRTRAAKARELEPLARAEKTRLAEQTGLEEARLKREQIGREEVLAREGMGRKEQIFGRLEDSYGQQPERTITAFNPERGIELATMTALLGAFAGSVSGTAALQAMEGVSTGYRTGQEDLYKREVEAYDAAVNQYKQKIKQAEEIAKNSLVLEAEKRGLGAIELKKLDPLLNDGLIIAKAKQGDVRGMLESIKQAKDLGDQISLLEIEAGFKPQKKIFQKLLDAESQLVIMDVSNPAYVLGENGEGRGGFVGYAAPPASSGSRGAKETQDDAKRKQGERNFSILTNELRNTYNRLQESGEIRDVNKPFLNNMYVYLATTGVGQEVQRMLGRSPQSDRDYTAGLRASLMNAIREATGLGSRSLDSNKELEFYLQAVTNPTATIQANMQALQSLEALYGNLKTIADNEGLDDASVIEGAIRTFGEHEPQRYKYSLSPTGQIQRTPRVRGQETATPAQPAAQQQSVDQRAIAIGERFQRGEITQEQAAQELRALGGFQ
jgi:hypothetical protein